MRKIRLRGFIVFGLAAISGVLLLYTSQNVQRTEEHLSGIESSIQNEQETIRVLTAEWEYLNNPERLEVLAVQHLGLGAPVADQMQAAPSSIPDAPAQTEENNLFQNISQESASVAPAAAPESSPVTVKPPRKPDLPKRNFDALLKSLDKGGAQ